jgi:predicted ATPase
VAQATILVGENGSGKSTLLEGIAEAYGLNPEGGSTGARFSTRRTESPLSDALQLVRGAGASRGGYFLRAETMHGLFSYLESSGPDPFHALSHGESFRAILESRTRTLRGDLRPGLYVLDEPESALSFTSALHALAALVEMTRASSHSGADRHPLPRLCRIARGRTVAVGHRRLACHHLGGSRPGGQRAVLPG